MGDAAGVAMLGFRTDGVSAALLPTTVRRLAQRRCRKIRMRSPPLVQLYCLGYHVFGVVEQRILIAVYPVLRHGTRLRTSARLQNPPDERSYSADRQLPSVLNTLPTFSPISKSCVSFHRGATSWIPMGRLFRPPHPGTVRVGVCRAYRSQRPAQRWLLSSDAIVHSR